jgi:hypothetical protein
VRAENVSSIFFVCAHFFAAATPRRMLTPHR